MIDGETLVDTRKYQRGISIMCMSGGWSSSAWKLLLLKNQKSEEMTFKLGSELWTCRLSGWKFLEEELV